MIPDLKTAQEEIKKTGLDDLIIKLDHVAYRVKMGQRDKAMAELANLVPYKEHKSFKVISMNAITSTLRLHDTLPVIVCHGPASPLLAANISRFRIALMPKVQWCPVNANRAVSTAASGANMTRCPCRW